MFSKFCLIVYIIFTFASNSEATVWDDIANYLNNPCNPSGDKQVEKWHGADHDKGDKNELCPPWNKSDGRDDHTCLANTDYPSVFAPWYLSHCAESTPESDFFIPKIRIRNQSCNAFACWTLSTTLKWDGECVVWPTPYGIPILRICARIALPADPKTGAPQDPGYTKGKHLDFEGYWADDEVFTGADGQPIQFDKPKLCAYRDPSILDYLSGGITLDGVDLPDTFDFNPLSQPLHKTNELSIVAKIFIFFLDTAKGLADTVSTLLQELFNLLGNSGFPGLDYFKPIFDVLGEIIAKASEIIAAIGDTLSNIIKQYGTLNRIVSDYQFGCVEIPLGPYPPPFCEYIKPYKPNASVQSVCATQDGNVISSTSNLPCVVSKLRNNFIHNVVRITYNNFVPLCASGEETTLTDKCITLSNIDNLNVASFIHAATSRRDMIKKCGDSAAGAACVNTGITFSCSISANGCEDGFRVVYASKTGTHIVPSEYFIDDLPDCSASNTTGSCQMVWGINTGEFIDVDLTFDKTESVYNKDNLSKKDIELKDTTGVVQTFSAFVARAKGLDTTSQIQKDPSQICVLDADNQDIGCVSRAEAIKPIVFRCDNTTSGLTLPNCSTSFFEPKFIITMKSNDDDYTSAVMEPLSISNPQGTYSTMNLAGYNFDSFVTDNTFIQKPFTGTTAPTPTTIYGTYKNGLTPFTTYNNNYYAINNATYLYGLEYKNDKYIQGGNYACASFRNTSHCPINLENCVLSKLLNSNIVDCTTFLNKIKTYPDLKQCDTSCVGTSCTVKDTTCTSIDSIAALTTGNTNTTIYNCTPSSGRNYHCYANTDKARNVRLCEISMSPLDRYRPAPDPDLNSITPLTGPNSHYADVFSGGSYGVGSREPFNSSLYGLRDKTFIELGLCVSIDQPTCPAISSPGSSDGNATWPEGHIGQIATGTCLPKTVMPDPSQSPTRYCLSKVDTKTIEFEPLTESEGCQKYTIEFISAEILNGSYLATQTGQVFGDDYAGGYTLGNIPYIKTISYLKDNDGNDHPEIGDIVNYSKVTVKLKYLIRNRNMIDHFKIELTKYNDSTDSGDATRSFDYRYVIQGPASDQKNSGLSTYNLSSDVELKDKLYNGINEITLEMINSSSPMFINATGDRQSPNTASPYLRLNFSARAEN